MVDIDEILARGGAARVTLLRYCILSITPEPLFVLLAGEYRLKPTHVGALALHDVFCASGAALKIRVTGADDLGMRAAIAPIRAQFEQAQRPPAEADEAPVPLMAPPRYVFDSLVQAARDDPVVGFAQLAQRYDPQRDAHENLPQGRMNEAQRHFVEYIWKPHARARLRAAGFWRIADIE